ncbi:hypothetical protein O0L34_g12107 [Tuta absoluta]|nr:hypothetical protein O0L34_g12107 [Tuta absoluta]
MPPLRRKPPPKPDGLLKKAINIAPPYKTPVHLDLAIASQGKWLEMVRKGEQLYKDDVDTQKKAQRGLRIKERRLPPEVVGRLYAQYCTLINDMYDAYLNNVQLQRAKYIQDIISVLVKR